MSLTRRACRSGLEGCRPVANRGVGQVTCKTVFWLGTRRGVEQVPALPRRSPSPVLLESRSVGVLGRRWWILGLESSGDYLVGTRLAKLLLPPGLAHPKRKGRPHAGLIPETVSAARNSEFRAACLSSFCSQTPKRQRDCHRTAVAPPRAGLIGIGPRASGVSCPGNEVHL